MKNPICSAAIALCALAGLAGCSDASIASHNLSRASEQFEIFRRVVFVNGITDTYLLEIVGQCSIYDDRKDKQIEVTCKTGDDAYKKHVMGLSDNVTYVVEQLEDRDVNVHHYRVLFKPQIIVPDLDIRFDADEVATPTLNRNGPP